MLRHERCPNAQSDAIENLKNFPVQQTHKVLLDAVQSEVFFHRIRTRAALMLADISIRLPDGLLAAPHPLLTYFQRIHCSNSESTVPKQLNFLVTSFNLQTYFVQQVCFARRLESRLFF